MNNIKTHFSLMILIMLFLCGFISGNAQATGSQTDDEKIYELKEVDKKPEILRRIKVRTDGSCRELSSGTAIFEVVLHRNGNVTKIKMLQSSQCDVFDRNAHDALKRIEFNPAVKDGQKVSVTRKFNFQFSFYY